MSKPIYVGMDDGHAEIKTVLKVDGKIRTMRFPSRVEAGITTSGMQGQAQNAYDTDGNQYTVATVARQPLDTRIPDYHRSDINRVLIHHALRGAGLGGKEVYLTTGLPLGDYFRPMGEGLNDRKIQEKEFSLKVPVRAVDNTPMAKIKAHYILGEALGAAVDQMFDIDGQQVEVVDECWAIIDIGGRTTDVIAILGDGERSFSIDNRIRDSRQAGVLSVISAAREAVADEAHVAVEDMPDMARVLENQYVIIRGQKIDMKGHIDRARRAVGSEISNYVEQKIGPAVKFSKVILVGGGAYLFREFFEAKYKGQLVIPPEPEFANARGNLKSVLIQHEMADQRQS